MQQLSFKMCVSTSPMAFKNVHEFESPRPRERPYLCEATIGDPTTGECSELGLGWNRERDTSVAVPAEKMVVTKRGILAKLAKIYDLLGLVSPTTLSGKLIYRAMCNTKTAWDMATQETLAELWDKKESKLPLREEIPRSLAVHRESIEFIKLHSFEDASANEVAACTYVLA